MKNGTRALSEGRAGRGRLGGKTVGWDRLSKKGVPDGERSKIGWGLDRSQSAVGRRQEIEFSK